MVEGLHFAGRITAISSDSVSIVTLLTSLNGSIAAGTNTNTIREDVVVTCAAETDIGIGVVALGTPIAAAEDVAIGCVDQAIGAVAERALLLAADLAAFE